MNEKRLSVLVLFLGLLSIGIALFPPVKMDGVVVIYLMATAFLLIGLSFSLRVATISFKELLSIVSQIMMAVGLTTAAVCLLHNPRLYFWLGLGIMVTGGLLKLWSNLMSHISLVSEPKDTTPPATD